jgi:predicted phage terminase large subunit-like protein
VLENSGQAPAAHHLKIIESLEDLTAGRVTRLMLLLPPGSAKSTFASVLFPAWWMARNPTGSVIAASHTASLAEHFGRRVRTLLSEHGARLNVFLRQDARAAGRFLTESGGDYFATGVQGAVTGRRADLALIDDPIASFEQAASKTYREHLWNWFRSELVTRMKPGGRIVLVMTRWHRDDLAGRLIEQGGWQTVRLPALADSDDPLGRLPGDALWPEWEDRAALLAKREMLGEQHFAAMFQQAPLAENGTIFDVSQIEFVDVAGPGTAVRGWDLAAGTDTSRDPDWTVGILLSRNSAGGYTVDDVKRVRVGPAQLNAYILNIARQDGLDVTVGLPRDPGQAGIHQVASLTDTLSGFRVVSSCESGTKEFRSRGVASQTNNKGLVLRRAPWNRVFLEELAGFPDGRKDDQVDALARAFGVLVAGNVTPAHYASRPIFGR